MKKLLLILTTILLISCDERPYSKVDFTEAETYGCVLVELTVRGKIHEYILYQNGHLSGMEHLPECKYCKEKEIDSYVEIPGEFTNTEPKF